MTRFLPLLTLALIACRYDVKVPGTDISWYDGASDDTGGVSLDHTIWAEDPIPCADVRANDNIIISWDEYWAGYPIDAYALVSISEPFIGTHLDDISAYIEFVPEDSTGARGDVHLTEEDMCPIDATITSFALLVCCY